MMTPELERAIVFSIPLVSALVCLTITAFDLGRNGGPLRRTIRLRAMATYGVSALCWFLPVSHSLFPDIYVRTLPLLAPAVMTACVLLYRMVCSLTAASGGKRLSRAHYIAPAAMLAVMTVLWIVTPVERIARIVYAVPVRSIAACIVLGICFSYCIVYPAAGIAKIGGLRRMTAGSAITESRTVKIEEPRRKTLARLYRAMILDLIVVPVPIFGLLSGITPFNGGGFEWIAAVLPSRIIYIISCFEALSDNHIAVETEQSAVKTTVQHPARLGRERVERYIETKKPWLNPAFRISDMAGDLFSNRAYISAFINAEYGMNFNRFINGFRLREVERLKKEAEQKKQRVPALQLILNAGFGNYRSYLRAKEFAAEGSGYGKSGRNENNGEGEGEYRGEG